MPNIMDMIDQLAGQMATPQDTGPAAPTIEQLRALKASRTPNAGVNTGGRHDPRRGSVAGNSQGPQRLVMPPSRGRDMTRAQSSADADTLNTVGDAIGGTDITSLAKANPQQLMQQGLQAVQKVATGQATPQDKQMVQDIIHAIQSGIIPATPQLNQLIDKMKSGKMLNQSNIPNF